MSIASTPVNNLFEMQKIYYSNLNISMKEEEMMKRK